MTQIEQTSFIEYEQQREDGNVLAVTRRLPVATVHPVTAFSRLAGSARNAFLLESVEGGERVAKYSFLGADPHMVVRGKGKQMSIERNGVAEQRDESLPDFLRRHFDERKLSKNLAADPLAGGAVGYFGYGASTWFEPALGHLRDDGNDDAVLMFYRTIVVFDHVEQCLKVVCISFPDESRGLSLHELYDETLKQIERTQSALQSAVPHITHAETDDEQLSTLSSNWTKRGFQDAVLKVKEHIYAGDCYQAVLSQRFTRNTTASDLSIYQALRETNPAPYTYLLRNGDESIIGASPEMLVRCRGTRLDYRPIAGTRPRGKTEVEDEQLAQEMCADEKEVAEHMMLVDLGRNDLGRVAAYGSVHVDELMSVERYSKVQHLVSSLSGCLRDDCDRFDALAACFPAGTVTGAPKVRAMEIIDELEPDARGIYAGSVFYIDYANNLDSCIAIRTLVLRNGQASVQAGAGIVADSVPEREYEETVHKAEALLRAVELAEAEKQPTPAA